MHVLEFSGWPYEAPAASGAAPLLREERRKKCGERWKKAKFWAVRRRSDQGRGGAEGETGSDVLFLDQKMNKVTPVSRGLPLVLRHCGALAESP